MGSRIADVVHTAAQVISRPFASFSEKTGTDMEPESSECNTEELYDRSSDKAHLFRLFVGWVPKLFTEEDLMPLFQKYGDVKDMIILKDKASGQPRGCAFVSYASKQEADAAIHALDKGVHLPGALCPMEVRYARSHLYIQAGSGPQDNRQLFFARAPSATTEDELKQLFGQYGDVETITLFRERRTHASKGCGFVTMATRDQAVAAMTALDEKQLLEGSITQLAVKWADPELQIKKKRAVEDSNADNRMLFFAKVLRTANEEEVKELFSHYGRVVEVNLFRAFQGAPTTKGCGLVTLGSNDEAAAAIEALDNKHVWEGMEAPMVVKWMDAALQKRRRDEHLLAMRSGQSPTISMSSSELWGSGPNRAASTSAANIANSSRSAGLSHGKLLEAAAAAANRSLNSESSLGTMSAGQNLTSGGFAGTLAETPPVGCAADAYKLFVGNIPKHYTEESLRPIFESVGPVVELVVVRDKFTHESKGSAFVWYRTRADADQAVLQYNFCRVLNDPTGEQTRPLVVRRANMRKPAAAMMAISPNPGASMFSLNPGSSASNALMGGAGPSGLGVSAVGIAGGAGAAAAGPGLASSGSLGAVLDLNGMGSGAISLGSYAGAEVPMHVQPMAAHTVQIQQQVQHPAADQYQRVTQVGLYAPVYPTGAESTSSTTLLEQYTQGSLQAALGATAAAPNLLQQVQQVQQQQQMQVQVQVQGAPQQQPQQQQYILTAHGTAVLPAQATAVPANATPFAGAAAYAPAAAAATPGLTHSGGGVTQVPTGIAGAAAGGGGTAEPVVQMSMQLSTAQMMQMSGSLYNVSAVTGASVATVPVAGGAYYINLTGARSQVESARQLVSSLINQLQQAGVL